MGYVVSGTEIPSQNWAVVNGVACKNMYVQGALVWQHTVPVTNMLANAGFSGGSTSGWNIEGIQGSYNNFSVTADGVSPSGYVFNGWYSTAIGLAYQLVTLYSGHIYYGRAKVATTCPNGANPVRIQDNPAANCSAPSGNGWVERAFRFGTQSAGNKRFEVGGDGNIGQSNRACGIMLVDLTAAFGPGNEPSIDFCNTWPWFDGARQIIY